jgi:hypothetical protein
MFLSKFSEDKLFSDMEDELNKLQNAGARKQYVEYLNSGEYTLKRAKKDPATHGLKSDDFIRHLKLRGWMFNAADDGCCEDECIQTISDMFLNGKSFEEIYNYLSEKDLKPKDILNVMYIATARLEGMGSGK